MRNFYLFLLLLVSINIVSETKFKILYLNSGSGKLDIERSILKGVEETLYESSNITLYIENLDLYSFNEINYKLSLKNHLITKYSKMKIDLIIFMNESSKTFYENYLNIVVTSKHKLYVDIVKNYFHENDLLDSDLNSIIHNPQIENTVNKFLTISNFPQIYILKREWESIPDINYPTVIINIDDVNFNLTNKPIYITPYTTDLLSKLVGNYIISSWEFPGIVGGYLTDPTTFGRRIAYTSKVKILGIDTKITQEEFKSNRLLIDYNYASLFTSQLEEGAEYFNLPRNKYEDDPSLMYR